MTTYMEYDAIDPREPYGACPLCGDDICICANRRDEDLEN